MIGECAAVQSIINRIQSKHDLSFDESYNLYKQAKADYIIHKYPSDNNRPDIKDFNVDEVIGNWIYSRMDDIVSRVGGANLKKYSENGMTYEYGNSGIDADLLAVIMPKAGVPR